MTENELYELESIKNEITRQKLEGFWVLGFHKSGGATFRIADMTDSHLENTIRKFNDIADTLPLKLEREARKTKRD